MLEARPSRWRRALVLGYLRRALRRAFDSARLWVDPLARLDEDGFYPLVTYANHQTWWDGFLAWMVFERFGQDYLVMMEEVHLRRFDWFRYAGVFGVDLEQPAGRAAGLRYAVRRLREPSRRRVVHLFPHGRLVPAHAPWPPFQGGLEALLRLAPGARAVPLALEIVPGRYRDAEIFLAVGPPAAERSTAALEAGLRGTLERLREHIAAGATEGAEWLLPPKRWSRGRTGGPERSTRPAITPRDESGGWRNP